VFHERWLGERLNIVFCFTEVRVHYNSSFMRKSK
jgi:hypothetical protein